MKTRCQNDSLNLCGLNVAGSSKKMAPSGLAWITLTSLHSMCIRRPSSCTPLKLQVTYSSVKLCVISSCRDTSKQLKFHQIPFKSLRQISLKYDPVFIQHNSIFCSRCPVSHMAHHEMSRVQNHGSYLRFRSHIRPHRLLLPCVTSFAGKVTYNCV